MPQSEPWDTRHDCDCKDKPIVLSVDREALVRAVQQRVGQRQDDFQQWAKDQQQSGEARKRQMDMEKGG